MSLNFDPSDDLGNVADGVETITLLRRGSTIGEAGEVVTGAVRRAMSAAEAAIVTSGDVRKNVAGDGQHTALSVVWHLPVAQLAVAPRLGDVILDGENRRWTILEVKHTTLGVRWRCETKEVAIAYGLDDTIVVLKTSDNSTWNVWRTGVRARIQPLKTEVATTNSVTATTRYCRIFVEENLDLSHLCRIRGPDGTLYSIVSTYGAERIGELQTIEAKIISS
jgi:hypothetical protein